MIPSSAKDTEGFYLNIRDQYFKILTSQEIPSNQKKEFYSMLGETIKHYRKSKDSIPKLKAFGESLVKNEEVKIGMINAYSDSNKKIKKSAVEIKENQNSLDKNLKKIKKGIDYKKNLEEKSKDALTRGNLGKN